MQIFQCDNLGVIRNRNGKIVGRVVGATPDGTLFNIDDAPNRVAALAELRTIREACNMGAVLSRRIMDGSGRVRHVEDIVDDAIALLEAK